MSTISETVSQALPAEASGYTQYVNPVVEALEQREAQIKGALAEYAQGRGVSADEVEDLFVEVGLSHREPEPDEHDANLTAIAARIDDLSRSLERLAGFARQHGFRV